MSELSLYLKDLLTINYWKKFIEKSEKYSLQIKLFIDYIPLIGPLYNAGYALNLLWLLFNLSIFSSSSSSSSSLSSSNNGNENNDENNDENNNNNSKMNEKYRKIRECGLISIITALIDIISICFTLFVIAFVCDCLQRINTFQFIRIISILFILINIISITIAAKILSKQAIINLNLQLEDVNYVGIKMVKSATITATAIERLVETTETTTNKFLNKLKSIWFNIVNFFFDILKLPQTTINFLFHNIKFCLKNFKQKIRLLLKNNLQLSLLLNLCTFGFYRFFMDKILFRNKPKIQSPSSSS